MSTATEPTDRPADRPSAAAVVRQPVTVGRPVGDLDEIYRLATALSQSGLLPQALRNKPSDVLATILYGQELGLAPMQAIQGVYVVNGRPTLAAQTWVALARKAGHKVRVTDETPTSCTVAVVRADDPGHPIVGTFTLDDTKRAGLAGKEVWKQHPAAMLYARAASIALRRGCPEIALGFYTEHEVEQPSTPSLATVAAERTDHQTARQQRDEDNHAAAVAALAALAADHPPVLAAGERSDLDDYLADAGVVDPRWRQRVLRALSTRGDAAALLADISTQPDAERVLEQIVTGIEEQRGWSP
ncbi:MAG: hypothetical protein ACRCZP_16340 [Phycicoccus sp.]